MGRGSQALVAALVSIGLQSSAALSKAFHLSRLGQKRERKKKPGRKKSVKAKRLISDGCGLCDGLNFHFFYSLLLDDEQRQPAIPALPLICAHR